MQQMHSSVDLRRTALRRAVGIFTLACVVNLISCTEYTPVSSGVAAPIGSRVRVDLTDQGTMSVAPRLGQRASSLEGVLQTMTDSTFSLVVTKVSRAGGIEDSYNGEQIALRRGDAETLRTSKTSIARSALLTAALVVSTFLIAKGAGDLSGGGSGGPPPPTK